jgi:hypothetical protein
MQATEPAVTKSLRRRKARPDSIRLTFRGAPADATLLDLPERRMWPVGIAFGVMFVIFAGVASVFKMRSIEVRGVFDLTFLLFEAFWVLAWMVGVAILGLLAVLFLFYGESAWLRNGRLVHAARLGPLKVLSEYALGSVRNVRVESAKSEGRFRVRFDYGEGDSALGDAMPEADAERLAGTLRLAASVVAPVSERAGSPGEVPATPFAPARAAEQPPPSLVSLSSLALIAANLVPIVGVLLFGWSAGHLMMLFWAESAVIGFYTVLRTIVVGKLAAIFAVPFFVGHFGGFMAIHFMFIYYFFVRGLRAAEPEPELREALLGLFIPLWPALAAFFVSHGVSFAVNFIGRREYAGTTVAAVTSAPYKRIILMQFTIIIGGWIVMALDNPVPALVLLVLLKIAVDLPAHREEHSKKQG